MLEKSAIRGIGKFSSKNPAYKRWAKLRDSEVLDGDFLNYQHFAAWLQRNMQPWEKGYAVNYTLRGFVCNHKTAVLMPRILCQFLNRGMISEAKKLANRMSIDKLIDEELLKEIERLKEH